MNTPIPTMIRSHSGESVVIASVLSQKFARSKS